VASENVIVVTETGAIVVGESGSRGEDVTPRSCWRCRDADDD